MLITALLQIGIGVVWVVAAIGKARTPGSTRATVERLVAGPDFAATLIVRSAVPVELILGVMLIARWNAREAALVSIVLFLLFAIALGRRAIRDALPRGDGSDFATGDCGCFGRTMRAQVEVAADNAGAYTPTAARAVARTLALAALAVAAAFGG